MSLGLLIVQARVAKEWEQKDLAAATGIDASTISKYESDRMTPRPKVLGLLEEVLDLQPGTLIEARHRALEAKRPSSHQYGLTYVSRRKLSPEEELRLRRLINEMTADE